MPIGEGCYRRTDGVDLLFGGGATYNELREGAICLDVLLGVDGIEVDESRQVGIVDVERHGKCEFEGTSFDGIGARIECSCAVIVFEWGNVLSCVEFADNVLLAVVDAGGHRAIELGGFLACRSDNVSLDDNGFTS